MAKKVAELSKRRVESKAALSVGGKQLPLLVSPKSSMTKSPSASPAGLLEDPDIQEEEKGEEK